MGGRGSSSSGSQGFAFPDLTRDQHFRRHGAEFNAKSAAEYEQLAATFAQRKGEDGVESFYSKGKNLFMYEQTTNSFLIQKPNGDLMTFFKPTSATYWLDQRMKYEG